MNKKIIYLALLASGMINYSFADVSKAQLLSQMSGGNSTEQPNNTNGGLVNNNVNYNNSTSTPTQTIAATTNAMYTSASNMVNNNMNYSNKYNQVSKPHKTYKKKKTVVKKSNIYTLGNQKFDITFSNDVSELPSVLKQYDPDLSVLPNLGKSSGQSVSFDLQNVGIDEISSMVQSLSGGAVRLIYDSNRDSIRLSYITTNKAGSNNPEKQSLAWREGKGKPVPIMTDDGVLLYPYGQYEPSVICKPLQVCDIRFETGEKIIDAVMGDTSRWLVQGITSGIGKNTVQHIILKPQYPDLTTNMIVTTDKGRVYNLKLVSSDKNYVSAVGWYYPQEINDTLDRKFKMSQAALANDGSSLGSSPNPINTGSQTTANGIKVNSTGTSDDDIPVLDLDFRYEISGDKVIWKPIRVFNDGKSTFIEVDKKSLNMASPVFMVYDENSSSYEMVNYRQKGNYYIVDQVFNVGVFVSNVGSNQLKVTMKHILDTNKNNQNWLY